MKYLFKHTALLSFAAVALFQLSARADDASERKILEGTWVGKVTNAGTPDRAGTGTMVTMQQVVFKNGVITASGGMKGGVDDLGVGTFTLNLKENPKHLDAVGTDGKTKDKTYQGIYKLEGDTLEWCASNPGIPRPTKFYTKPQVQFYMILKKQN